MLGRAIKTLGRRWHLEMLSKAEGMFGCTHGPNSVCTSYSVVPLLRIYPDPLQLFISLAVMIS